MTPDQMTQAAEDEYFVTLHSAKFYLSDETSKVGFFVRFPDYDELKEQNQYRIIPNNNAIQYHKDKDDAENAIKHSIIINGDEVISIRSGYRGMRDLTTKDLNSFGEEINWMMDSRSSILLKDMKMVLRLNINQSPLPFSQVLRIELILIH